MTSLRKNVVVYLIYGVKGNGHTFKGNLKIAFSIFKKGFKKGFNSIRKEFAPLGSKFFSFRVKHLFRRDLE